MCIRDRNELTDTLLKKEFDECRKNKKSHRKLIEKGLDHIIPYDGGSEILTNSKNEKKEFRVIDIWRDARSKGIKARFKDTNIILQGGLDDVWFNTKTKKLIIVGSGAIGIEFAYFYNTMGTEVTIIEFMDRIIPVEDEEVSKQLEKSFKKSGIKIIIKFF